MKSMTPWRIIKQTVTDWLDDKAARLGAALAFYSVLSLAPLLVIVLAIAGAVFQVGKRDVRQSFQADSSPPQNQTRSPASLRHSEGAPAVV